MYNTEGPVSEDEALYGLEVCMYVRRRIHVRRRTHVRRMRLCMA
jgi:hypothetical protein